MHKVGELFASSAGRCGLDDAAATGVQKEDAMQGSGGGGPVEAVWWVNLPEREKPIMTQWRVRGSAWVVGPDIEGESKSSGVRTVKSEVGARMRILDESKVGDWTWERELRTIFGNQSPGIRGAALPSAILAEDSRS